MICLELQSYAPKAAQEPAGYLPLAGPRRCTIRVIGVEIKKMQSPFHVTGKSGVWFAQRTNTSNL
jgi:hypothetical protein